MTSIPPKIRSVCVYCGSRKGGDEAYMREARRFGQGLAKAGLRLVYGAGDVGLMGETAKAALAAGGDVLGVIPEHLREREIALDGLTTLIVTETMHERKKVMLLNSDAIVALPGGPGTLDEMMEALTWRQLGLHDKPAYILNVGGYWDPLVALLRQTIDHGFADESFTSYYEAHPDAESLLKALAPA